MAHTAAPSGGGSHPAPPGPPVPDPGAAAAPGKHQAAASGAAAKQRPPMHPGAASGAGAAASLPAGASGGLSGGLIGAGSIPRKHSVPSIPAQEEVEKKQAGVTAQADDARLLGSPSAKAAAAVGVGAAFAGGLGGEGVQAGPKWRPLLEEQLRCVTFDSGMVHPPALSALPDLLILRRELHRAQSAS
jgi:hypothetical protein